MNYFRFMGSCVSRREIVGGISRRLVIALGSITDVGAISHRAPSEEKKTLRAIFTSSSSTSSCVFSAALLPLFLRRVLEELTGRTRCRRTPQYHNPRVAAPRNRRRSVACVSLRSPAVSSSLVLESRCALLATPRAADMDSSGASQDTSLSLCREKCLLTPVLLTITSGWLALNSLARDVFRDRLFH